ncbi:MAG: divergent polysaccharide deacetylase family protein [Firmicutes bacterium]|nr:divergent polysaccharide deacetylase family protein [Bacillota bacterium]
MRARHLFLILILAGLGIGAFLIGLKNAVKEEEKKPSKPHAAAPQKAPVRHETPPASSVIEVRTPSPEPSSPPGPAQDEKLLSMINELPENEGKIAIIIDDCGNDLKTAEDFMDSGFPLTLAVMPKLRYSTKIAVEAKSKNQAVILHLPMEPVSEINPGPGEIKTGMTPEEVEKIVAEDLQSVPGAEGINNHEGSKATRDEKVMAELMSGIKSRNLYFVDSLTVKDSLGASEAEKAGVPFARRKIFLDNNNDGEYICGQLIKLARTAKTEGYAIGIGHVRKSTFEALKKYLPLLQEKGITIVPLNDLINKNIQTGSSSERGTRN